MVARIDSDRERVKRAMRRFLLGVGVAAGSACLLPSQVFAAPEGEQVVTGSAEFSRQGSVTQITAANNTIINYSSFDILAGETVQFVQPNEAARVLNRVDGPIPTTISGNLLSNGIVYITNPAGVVFANGSFVNVGGIVAAAGTITNSDFLNNVNQFTDLKGDVINQGTILGGDSVVLVGQHVANYGSIEAERGLVVMQAGDDVYVGERDGQIVVKVSSAGDGGGDQAGVENTGTIEAPRGRVRIGAGDMYALAIRQSGRIKADSVTIEGGEGGTVEVSGTIDASNLEPIEGVPGSGGRGGEVEVLGDKVAVLDAKIDASGATGGGTVLIGGDYQGKGQTRTASRTYIGPSTEIRADAGETGDGGKVIVWGDEVTGFYGRISARGGQVWGDGGLVETSGRGGLSIVGASVDVGADFGSGGTWLLDPTVINVVAAAAETTDLSIFFGDGDVGGDGSTDVDVTAINGAGAGTTVVMQATDAINFDAAVNITSNANLVAQAGGNINVNQAITLTGGNLHLEADSPHSSVGAADGMGDITGSMGTNISTNGGDVTLIGGDISFDGMIDLGGGDVAATLTNSPDISIDSFLDVQNAVNVAIGQATTAGTDGEGAGALVVTANSLTVTMPLDFGDDNVSLIAATTINETVDGSAVITTGSLTMNAGGAIDGTGGAVGFETDVASLSVTTTSGGNATITDATGGVILGAFNVAGNLTVTATAGDITDSGIITVGGNASFTTSANDADITLNAVDGTATDGLAVTGTLALNTAGTSGDATVVTNGGSGINFAAGTVNGNLTATAQTGNITDNGVVTVGGNASFTTVAVDADITLNNGAAVTGTVTLDTTGTDGDAEFSNGANALTLNASSVAGDITASGSSVALPAAINTPGNVVALTATGAAGSVTSSLATAVTAGTLNLSTGSGGVSNGSGGALSTSVGTLRATTTGGGDATIVNAGSFTFAATSNISGNLTATATTGDITVNTNGIIATGDVRLTAAGNIVADNNVDAQIEIVANGAVSFTADRVSGSTPTQFFQVNNATEFVIHDTGPGDILVHKTTAAGTITGTEITVDGVNLGAIQLRYDGVGTVTDVAITNAASAPTIGAVRLGHDFSFTYGGTENVALANSAIAGPTAGVSIPTVTLTAQNGGFVTANTTTVPEISEATAVNLTGAIIGTSTNPIDVSSVTTLNVTDSGAGSTVIREQGTAAIMGVTLNVQGPNNGTAAVTFASGNTLNVADGDAGTIELSGLNFTTLVGGTTARALTVNATGGNVVQTAALTSNGAVTVTTSTANADILLGNTSNALTGTVTLATTGTDGDVVFHNGTNAVNLDASGLEGDITLTGSSITLPAAINTPGNVVMLTATGGSITSGVMEPVITADTVDLSATAGINDGMGGTPGPLTTVATSLAVDGGTGLTSVRNTNGEATTTVTSLSSTTGNVTFEEAGSASVLVMNNTTGGVNEVSSTTGAVSIVAANGLTLESGVSVVTTGGGVTLSQAGTGAAVLDLSGTVTTGGGDFTATQAGTGTVTIAGDINTSSATGDGGDILITGTDAAMTLGRAVGVVTLNSSTSNGGSAAGTVTVDAALGGGAADGTLTIASGGVTINTTGGVDPGTFVIDGVDEQGTVTHVPTPGPGEDPVGTVFLHGSLLDLIVDADFVSRLDLTSAITRTANRDIVFTAPLTTTDAGSNLVFTADGNNDGVGGIFVQGDSPLNSSGGVTLTGSSFTNLGGAGEANPDRNPANDVGIGSSIFIANGAGSQITAVDGITLEAGTAAPAGAGIVVGGKLTAGGAVSITSSGGITIDAAIDPTQVVMESADDIAINAAVVADDLIQLTAGTDGTGGVAVSGTGSLVTSAAGSDVTITSGATSGGVDVDGLVTAVDVVTIDAGGGAITSDPMATGARVTGASLNLDAATGISADATAALAVSAGSIAADNTTGGGVNLTNTGTGATEVTSLTAGGGGAIGFTQTGTGDVTFSGKVTTDGAVNVSSVDSIVVDAEIDPLQVVMSSQDDITVNAAVAADFLVQLTAGSDGSGSLTVGGAGSVTTSGVGSDITLSAGATSGGVDLDGTVTAVDLVTVTAAGGAITGDGTVRGARLDLNAGAGISRDGTDGLATAAGTISADSTGGGLVSISNTNPAGPTTILSLSGTTGDVVFVENTGGSPVAVAAGATISTTTGSISITATNSLTVNDNASITTSGVGADDGNVTLEAINGFLTIGNNVGVDTTGGTDATLTVTTGVTIGTGFNLTIGGGDVTLRRRIPSTADIVVSTLMGQLGVVFPLDAGLVFEAGNNITVDIPVITTAGNGVTLISNADLGSFGAVVIQAGGQINSGAGVTLTKQNGGGFILSGQSVVIADDVTPGVAQIIANGDVVITSVAPGPGTGVDQDIVIDGDIITNGGTLRVMGASRVDIGDGVALNTSGATGGNVEIEALGGPLVVGNSVTITTSGGSGGTFALSSGVTVGGGFTPTIGAGDIELLAQGDDLVLAGGGSFSLFGLNAPLRLEANRDIIIGVDLDNNTNAVTLVADRDHNGVGGVLLRGDGRIAGGAVTLTGSNFTNLDGDVENPDFDAANNVAIGRAVFIAEDIGSDNQIVSTGGITLQRDEMAPIGAASIDVQGKLNANGVVTITSNGNINVSGGIDPTEVVMTSRDNITISSSVVATNLIDLRAGTDGSGSVVVNGGGSLRASSTTGDVVLIGGTGGGTGTVTIDGPVQAGDRADITAATAIQGGALVTAPTLSLDAGTTIDDGGTPQSLRIRSTNLTVQTGSGDALIVNEGSAALTLEASSVGGDLAVSSPNDLIVGAGITAAGTISLEGDSDSNGVGAIRGPGLVTASDVSLSAGNGIDNGSGGRLLLDANSLTVGLDSGDALLDNDGALTFVGASSISGDLDVTADGIVVTGNIINTVGTTTLDAQGGSITGGGTVGGVTVDLRAATGISSVVAANNLLLNVTGGNATVTDANGFTFGAGGSSVNGNLTATATTGGILDAGTVAVTGNASFTANGVGGAVGLDQLDVTGTIAVNTLLGNATITNAQDVELAGSTVGNDLVVTAGVGTITDGAAVSVGGDAQFTANGAGGGIVLDQTAVGGAVLLRTSGNANIVHAGNLILGPSSVTGNLTARSTGGNLLDLGSVTLSFGDGTTLAIDFGLVGVQGDASFTSDTGLILLDELAVDGTVALSAVSGNATVVNDDGLTLGASNVGGDLSATASNGAIGDGAAVTVAGSATFTANGTGGGIELDLLNLTAGGPLSVNSSGDAMVMNPTAGTLTLGTSTVNGLLTLETVGDLNGTGLVTAGNADLTAGGVVNLNTSFGSLTLDAGGNTTIDNDSSDLTLNDVTVAGTFGLESFGDVTVDGAVAVAGSIDISADGDSGVGSLTVNDTGSIETTAADSDVLIVTGVTASDIMLNGPVTATREVTLRAPGGSITGAAVVSGTTVDLTANEVISSDGATGLFQTDADRLRVSTTSGGAFIGNTGPGGGAVTNLNNVVVSGGDFVLVNSEGVTIDGPVVILNAGGGGNGSVTTSVGDLRILDTATTVAANGNLTFVSAQHIVTELAASDAIASGGTLTLQAAGNILANRAMTAVTGIVLEAGTDGSGNLTVGGGATVTGPAPNSDITLSAGMAGGSGTVLVNGPVSANDTVTITATDVIQGTSTITAGTLDLNAATGIGEAGTALNVAATSITADNTGTGVVNLSSVNPADVAVASLTTGNGDVTVVQSGGGALSVTGGASTGGGDLMITQDGDGELRVAGTISTSGGNATILSQTAPITLDGTTIQTGVDGVVNGGDILVQVDTRDDSDKLFLNGVVTLDTLALLPGADEGVFTLRPGVRFLGGSSLSQIAGAGDITLDGGGTRLVVGNLTSQSNLRLESPGDIIINGRVETTGDSNIQILADSGPTEDGGGVDGGGVIVEGALGQVVSGGTLSISGSGIQRGTEEGAAPLDVGVQVGPVDAVPAFERLTAVGNIAIATTASGGTAVGIVPRVELNDGVRSTTGNITVDAVDGVVGQIDLGSTLTAVTGTIDLLDPTELTDNTTLVSPGFTISQPINDDEDPSNPGNLTINITDGGGEVSLEAAIGDAEPIAGLTVNGPGTLVSRNGNITTLGNQAFNGPVRLEVDSTFTSAGGGITIGGDVTNGAASGLTLVAATGVTTTGSINIDNAFTANAGTGVVLSNLTVGSAGATLIAGTGDVSTSGVLDVSGALSAISGAGNIVMGNSVTVRDGGGTTLTANNGDITITGVVASDGVLSATAGDDVAINNDVTVTNGGATLRAIAGDVSATGTIMADDALSATADVGSVGLADISANGVTANAGVNVNLTGLTMAGAGGVSLTATGGNVTITGEVTSSGTFTGSAGDSIALNNNVTVTAGGANLTAANGVTTTALVTTSDALSATATAGNVSLAAVSASGVTATAGLNVSLSGATMAGAGGVSLTATGGTVTTTGEVTSSGTFAGNAGNSIALNNSVTVSNGGATLEAGSGHVTTLGVLDVSGMLEASSNAGNIVIGNNVTVRDGGGMTLTAGSTATGMGMILTGPTTMVNVDGALTATAGNTAVYGGPVNVTSGNFTTEARGNVIAMDAVTVNNGDFSARARGEAGTTMPNLADDPAPGILNVVARGDVEVQGVTITGTGAITLESNRTIDPSGGKSLPMGTIMLHGDLMTEGGSIVLNEGGRPGIPSTATIAGFESAGFESDGTHALPDASQTLDIMIKTNGGEFRMGAREKITVNGDLTIDTSNSMGVGGAVTVGDLNANGVITINAGGGTMTMILRSRGPILDSNGGILTSLDDGVDIVAIGPNREIILQEIAGNNIEVSGEGEAPKFSIEEPFQESRVSSVRAVTVGGLGALIGSTTTPITEVFFKQNPVFALDFRFENLVNLATVFPFFDQVEEMAVTEEALIEQAQKDKLRQLGIYAHDLATEQLVDFLLDGVAVIDDIGPELRVAVPRVHPSAVVAALNTYTSIFWKPVVNPDTGLPVVDETGQPRLESQAEGIRRVLDESLTAYLSQAGKFDASGFRQYLETEPSAGEALGYITQLQTLFEQIRLIGITPKEMSNAKGILLGLTGITPAEITWQELSDVIEGVKAGEEEVQDEGEAQEEPAAGQGGGVPGRADNSGEGRVLATVGLAQ